MGIQHETRVLEASHGLDIHVEVRRPDDTSPRATVIVCHGFKGFKRWGFFPHLGEQLARAGFAAVCFDFSGNGVGDGGEEFARLDLFERNTYSQEMVDLDRVLLWCREEVDWVAGSIGLLGHSRGAVPVVVAAAEHPDEVSAVVTWNGVGRALRFTPGQLDRWEADRRMEFTNARTGQRMAMDFDFVRDARSSRFDLAARVLEMRAPHLIVHGSADMAVDPAEAEMLRASREDRCAVEVVDGATHTFGAVHPFVGSTPYLDRAVDKSVAWFERWLG